MRATVASPLERPVPAADLPAQRANLNEVEAKAWLRRYGFQAPESIVLPVHGGTPADGRTIPFPAAVKVLSADLLHKSDVGGVVLDVKDEAELAVAVSDIRAAVSKRGPAVRIEGFLVERMMEGRAEAILSVTRTREFGPVVMLGLGGTLVELLRRATFRLPPVSLPQAEDMIAEIGMRELLAPARAKAAGDIDALAMAIVRLSDAAARADWPFDTLEINPLLVRVKGDGVVALDAVAQPHASRTC
jgi:succinyl-CoA synthetase beta subunit